MGHAVAVKARTAKVARTHEYFEKVLLSRKRELEARISDLLADVVTDGEPEDEGGIAIQNYSKDWAAATLDRTRRMLIDVESALARIESGDYGACATCHMSIPAARLEALPWARLCIQCAERGSEGPENRP